MKIINKWLVRLLQALIRVLERNERAYTLKTLQEDRTPLNNHTEGKAGIELLIIRKVYTDDSIIGRLFLNGESFCDTLELPFIGNRQNVSCIPSGRYKLRIRKAEESASRNYTHLLVKDVPNRNYILFHKGNYPQDTKGCILVGMTNQHNFVGNSEIAMDLLVKEILNLGGNNIKLIIKNR